MVRSIVGKAMWLARGTSMVVGLAVMLAVVMGVATAALAAVPGDPFRLGKNNSINRLSTLVGSTANAMLKVDNNGTGPALQLEANASRPPLTVNADAGTATNLDADKLDGKDSSDLAVRTAFTSGPGAAPDGNLRFLVAPARVTVGAGQAVHVTSNKAFGTTVSGGAGQLNLYICYRSAGTTGTPNQVGEGSLGQRVGQNERVVMGLSAVIAGLPAGSYDVGLCGKTADGSASWNSNDYGYTSALVVTQTS